MLFSNVLMPSGHRLWPQLRVLYTSVTKNTLSYQEGPESEIQLLYKPYRRAELAYKIRPALTRGQP